MLLYNTEWWYDHGITENYSGNSFITLGLGKLKWQKAKIVQIERLNTAWKHACQQHRQEKD